MNQGTFTIKIDDEFCEYEYKIQPPEDIAIYDIIKIVCDKLGLDTPEGRFVKNHIEERKMSKFLKEYIKDEQ